MNISVDLMSRRGGVAPAAPSPTWPAAQEGAGLGWLAEHLGKLGNASPFPATHLCEAVFPSHV